MKNFDVTMSNAVILEWSEIQNCFHDQDMCGYGDCYLDEYMTIAIADRIIIAKFIDSLGEYRKKNYTFLEMATEWVKFCKDNTIGGWVE